MKATAYVVGPSDGPGAALTEMVKRFNFASVRPYAGVAQAEQQARQTPVCFFLFGAVAEVDTLRGVAEAIRFSASRRIRFSPLIYFSESPSIEAITSCINMGFDDVITMPFTRSRVMERINRQVGSRFIYYETASYFGPDRRGRLPIAPRPIESRQGRPFRRMEIVRNLATGVTVVRDDCFEQAQTRQPAGA